MPYLMDTYTPEEADESIRTFYPTTPVAWLANAARVEMWGSSFDDPGEDWTEVRFITADGTQLGSVRCSGY
jgi:hypothetical protein